MRQRFSGSSSRHGVNFLPFHGPLVPGVGTGPNNPGLIGAKEGWELGLLSDYVLVWAGDNKFTARSFSNLTI
jgi:hypothetical protein